MMKAMVKLCNVKTAGISGRNGQSFRDYSNLREITKYKLTKDNK